MIGVHGQIVQSLAGVAVVHAHDPVQFPKLARLVRNSKVINVVPTLVQLGANGRHGVNAVRRAVKAIGNEIVHAVLEMGVWEVEIMWNRVSTKLVL